MRSARINFIDLADGTISIRPVFLPVPMFFGSGFEKSCHAHQACAMVWKYLDSVHAGAPADAIDLLEIPEMEASRGASVDADGHESGASMEFTEVGHDFNCRVTYWPTGCNEAQYPSHKSCALGVAALNAIFSPLSDAIVKRGGEREEVYVTIPKESLGLIRSLGARGNA